MADDVQQTSTEEERYELCDEQRGGACKINPDFDISLDKCLICGIEHDSPEFGPYCALCHDFLYPNALQVGHERQIESEQFSASRVAAASQSVEAQSGVVDVFPAGVDVESEHSRCGPLLKENDLAIAIRTCTEITELTSYKLPYLSLYERIRAPDLVAKRLANELNLVEEDLFETLPPEILLMIFSFLDDISLCMAGQVCQWWHQLAGEPNQWHKHLLTRWPLFRTDNITIRSWQKLYIKMLQGVTCRRCFEQGCIQHSPEDDIVNSWRNKRLKSELKGLIMDPPEGIRACPLDKSLSYWQASITGPTDCPYEGGLFFLHLEIPKSYPMRPPIARFITKIFHPNVSYHGDIGVDALRHNWSLALTIPKVLVSIQSLLTDPYCQISMEPEVADICENDREGFDKIATAWTRKYAKAHLTC